MVYCLPVIIGHFSRRNLIAFECENVGWGFEGSGVINRNDATKGRGRGGGAGEVGREFVVV